MDTFPIAFYAALCGLVGLAAPRFSRWPARLAFGAALGVAAATAMPHIRAFAGL
ncbi:hypothetical protein ACVDG3_02790 [Meridianimarinicoccus sp. RP-17]|uniref:hypothetical protein n=1 Tax=Meridianimarinicoccus zhengii TaxID=2056810 RepID=UPI001C9AA233|nr:hypothetical protein [Phycocomes zhengii]